MKELEPGLELTLKKLSKLIELNIKTDTIHLKETDK